MNALLIAALLSVSQVSDTEAAQRDYYSLPAEQQKYAKYITTSPNPELHRKKWEQVAAYQIPAASREVMLDYQIPYKIEGSNVYRIDLKALGWGLKEWDTVVAKYPYSTSKYAIIRADWLVYQLADPTQSDAYELFLYGAKSRPKNNADFFKFWGADPNDFKDKTKNPLLFGWIEGDSKVSKQDVRFIVRLNTNRGSVWSTQDIVKTEANKDPVQNPDGNFAHDGEEHIVLVPKLYGGKYGGEPIRGAMNVYALFNGAGKTVQEAPVDLVEDYTRFKTNAEIINNGSCVQCHTTGMQYPSELAFKELLKDQVQLYVKDKNRLEAIERLHLGDVKTQLRRDEEDFRAAVKACNGLSSEENAALYRFAILDYGRNLTLERAATELYCTPEDLKLALGYASANKIELSARMAWLASDRPIPRAQFEQDYLAAQAMLKVWRSQ